MPAQSEEVPPRSSSLIKSPTSQPALTSASSSSATKTLKPLRSHPVYPPSTSATTTNLTTGSAEKKGREKAQGIKEEEVEEEDGKDGSRGQPAATAAGPAELARAKMTLRAALRNFADFPIKGIDFVDIMPLFADPAVHACLGDALEMQVRQIFNDGKATTTMAITSTTTATTTTATTTRDVDVVVGLDARGFLFGPGLALRLGAGFAAVRKKGKLPGPCVTAAYEKEYGTDFFQMQSDAIKEGQRVLIADDIIATGGSAKAAGDLVKQLGGVIIGYLFVVEIPGLNGIEKLDKDVPAVVLL